MKCAGAGVAERCLLGRPAEELHSWWGELEQNAEPCVAAFPGERAAWPLWFHADETQYVQHGEKKAYVLSFCSLVCGKRYLLAVIPTHLMVVEEHVNKTLWALLAWLRYELECLHAGRYPAQDWQGNDFRDHRSKLSGARLPVRARALAMKGDQKFLHEAYRWGRSWAHNNCCRHCLASKKPGANLWTDMSDTAGWKNTISPAPSAGPLADFLPAVDDLFHTLWVNGSGSDLVGSCLCWLACLGVFADPDAGTDFQVADAFVTFHGEAVGDGRLEADDEAAEGGDHQPRAWNEAQLNEQLRRAHLLFLRWAKESRAPNTQETFTTKLLHCVSKRQAPQCGGKGCDTRLTLLWLDALLRMPGLQAVLSDPSVAAHAVFPPSRVCLCVNLLAYFVFTISAEGDLLSQGAARKLQLVGDGFVKTYLGLAGEAVRHGAALFKVRPKLHGLWHLSQDIKILNPKMWSCILDESFMGVVARVAEVVHPRTRDS